MSSLYVCRPPGAFSGLRLLPGEALDEAAPGMLKKLAEGIIADPPYELRWLKGVEGQMKVRRGLGHVESLTRDFEFFRDQVHVQLDRSIVEERNSDFISAPSCAGPPSPELYA